ncbi:hypothetical protein ACFFJX_27705 [Pseudarcicella hirudinis]|uniref:hypothetical protein n=1 Tax=Pseudarcicella hirudinis TaxID=1079859 RepID=UPI0035EEAC8F
MWKKFNVKEVEECVDIIAYSPSFIDEEYNPRGIRIGYLQLGVFHSARFKESYRDSLIDFFEDEPNTDALPEEYMEIPKT